jgi:amino acid permease
MKNKYMQLFTASSMIAGTCIGAGFLGIPFVASRAGFFVALAYLIIFLGVVLLINLYIGEIILRTKGNHQLAGYANKYLGKKGKFVMLLATKFTIYSAIVAYLIGVGESISFLFFGNVGYYIVIGVLFGGVMSFFVWKGVSSLKFIEKAGVITSLAILFLISIMFFNKIDTANLFVFNSSYALLPFGVILFSMMSFFSIPHAKIILKNNRNLMKKAIIIGTCIPAVFYTIFTLVVVGYMGSETPQIATFALGGIFVFMGIVTMVTSYISLANALKHNYMFDYKISKRKAWFRACIIPIFVFLFIQIFGGLFSFIRVISIGGVVSGGVIGILVLMINKRAEKRGDRHPEFFVPINNWIVRILSFVFILGIFLELFKMYLEVY